MINDEFPKTNYVVAIGGELANDCCIEFWNAHRLEWIVGGH